MIDARRTNRQHLIGLSALAFSALYFVSDALEVVHGGFSEGQLWMTLTAEAAIPVFAIGLCVVQRPEIGRLGRIGALAYAYSYVFFTGTVVYALLHASRDFSALSNDLSPWMVIHGALMVFAGLAFGYGVIRAGVLPRWTGVALMTGVVLVSLAQVLPEGPQLLAAGVRDLGFAGMGVALLRSDDRSARTLPGQSSDAIEERVHGGWPLLSPVRQAVTAGGSVVRDDLDDARRTALDDSRVDALARQGSVGQVRQDGRAGVHTHHSVPATAFQPPLSRPGSQ
jgi:hypothetical protein